MKHWPFNVIEEDTLPKLRVEYKNEQKTFSPEEISSMVLIKMKKTAEVGNPKLLLPATLTHLMTKDRDNRKIMIDLLDSI